MSEIAAVDTPPPPPPPDPPRPPEVRELHPPDTVDARSNTAAAFDPMADLTPPDTAPPTEADAIDERSTSQDSQPAAQHDEFDPIGHLDEPETGSESDHVETTDPPADAQVNDRVDDDLTTGETAQPAQADTLDEHPHEPDGQSDQADETDEANDPLPAAPAADTDEPVERASEADVPQEHPDPADADDYDPLSQLDQQHEEQTAGPDEDRTDAAPTEVPATADPVATTDPAEHDNLDQPPRDRDIVEELRTEPHDSTGGQATDDGIARYGPDDLSPTDNRSSIYGTELMSGPDGHDHFPGDRIGTFRDSEGRLHDSESGSFTADDNRPATDTVQLRAVPDLDNTRTYSTAPADMSSAPPEAQATAQDVRDAVANRQEIVERRTEIWDNLQPLATKLGEATNQTVGPNDFHADRFNDLRDQADLHLTRAERVEFANLGKAYIDSGNELNRASERLGAAGGAHMRAQEFSGSQPVTGGDGVRGSAGNLDTIAYLDGDPPTLLAFEEKGAGGKLGFRIVADPAIPDSAYARAEQGSPEYLRHMLQHDNKLTEAARADPAVTARLQAAVDSGNVRYLLVHTAPDGTVTVTDFRLDPSRVRLDNLRILRNRETHDR